MKPKYKRLQVIVLCLICAILGLWLILRNFNQNIVFFYTPTELKEQHILKNVYRVGGLVVKDSIIKLDNGLTTQFTISDNQTHLLIRFTGILPSLFREGQGIVAKGKLENDVFIAQELLAKHDENYKPPTK
jgi:cytochrome c-type biogenesis protein CcmE